MSKTEPGYPYYKSTAWKRLLQSLPATYVVWADESTTPTSYRAECNFSGGSDLPASSDASAIIQGAIDAVPTLTGYGKGGTVFVRNGAYDADFTMKANVRLVGESLRQTRIQGTITLDDTTASSSVSPCWIEHMTVDAKTAGENYAIIVEGTPGPGGITFRNLRVMGTLADFKLSGTDMYKCRVEHVTTMYGGTYAFYVDGTLDEWTFKDVIVGYQDYGLYQTNDATAKMINGIFEEFRTADIRKKALVATYADRCCWMNSRFGDINAAADVEVIILDDTSASTVQHTGNNFINCQFLFGAGTATTPTTVRIGRNYYGTTFTACQGFSTFVIDPDATNTCFRDFNGYRTPYYSFDPTFTDNGINTIWEGAAFPELTTRSIIQATDPEDAYMWLSLDDGAGAVATDETAHGNDGALSVAPPDWVAGKWGSNALDFDHAVPDYVTVTRTADLDVGVNDFSASFWAYIPVAAAANSNTVLCKRNTTGLQNEGYQLQFQNPGRLYFYICDGSDDRIDAALTGTIEFDAWHHFAVTVDRDGYATGYMDNVLTGSVDVSAQQLTIANALDLGVGYNTTPAVNESCTGKLDEIRFYLRVLNQSEIRALYETGYLTYAGQLWSDTTAEQLKVRNADNKAWRVAP